MNPTNTTLALVAALTVAGLAKRRGSRSVDAEQLYKLVELYDTEDHREQAEELISTLGVEDWEKKAKHLRFLMRGRERMSARSKVGFLKAPSGKLSQMLVDEYLRLIGYKSDRYGNFVRTTASGDMRKVKFTRNNMQLFGGRPGRWYKMSSTPYTTLAIEYLIKSARIVGDTQALEQLQAIKDKKAGTKKRASDRRFEKEYEKYAQDIAVIQATSVLRDELEDDLVSQTLSPQAIRRINEQAEKRKPAVLQRLKATGKRAEYAAPLARRDGEMFSFDKPPHQWHLGTPIVWDEDGYTVFFAKGRRGMPLYHIGKGASFGFIDPTVGGVQPYPAGVEDPKGEGHITGKIYFLKGQSKPMLSVWSVASGSERGGGVGTKLLSFVRRIAKGYGTDEFAVEAITDEGLPFWEHMEATGKLTPSRPPAGNGRIRFYRV
jgi:hypothetical protein